MADQQDWMRLVLLGESHGHLGLAAWYDHHAMLIQKQRLLEGQHQQKQLQELVGPVHKACQAGCRASKMLCCC